MQAGRQAGSKHMTWQIGMHHLSSCTNRMHHMHVQLSNSTKELAADASCRQYRTAVSDCWQRVLPQTRPQ
jgi:hypothetical protein